MTSIYCANDRINELERKNETLLEAVNEYLNELKVSREMFRIQVLTEGWHGTATELMLRNQELDVRIQRVEHYIKNGESFKRIDIREVFET